MASQEYFFHILLLRGESRLIYCWWIWIEILHCFRKILFNSFSTILKLDVSWHYVKFFRPSVEWRHLPHPTALEVGSVHYNYISSEYKFATSYVLRKTSRVAGVGGWQIPRVGCEWRCQTTDPAQCYWEGSKKCDITVWRRESVRGQALSPAPRAHNDTCPLYSFFISNNRVE